MEKIIGAQMYTVRDYVKDEKALENTFKRFSEIGYTYAQASAMTGLDAEVIKRASEKYGIKVTGNHYDFDKMIGNIDETIKYHKTFGCIQPGIGGLPLIYRDSKEAILSFMEKANKISDIFAENGLMFTYHNHAFEFSKTDGKNIMDYIIENASENFKLMFDVYWASYAGINPVKFIKNHKDIIGGVHYKDLKIVEHRPEICEVGEGNLDWEEIVSACDETGVKYIYVEQDSGWSPDPFTSLEISYNNLKKYGYR